MAYPTILVDAIKYFADEQICIDAVAEIKWPDGVVSCSGCGEVCNTIWLANQKRWKCRGCKKQFSVKVGTIFYDSPLSLDKWMVAMWMLANCRNGVSSYEIARTVGVTQKSAWHMLHRIRTAMMDMSSEKIGGSGQIIETDETFVCGKIKNMHKKKENKAWDRPDTFKGKTIVVGMLECGGKVRAGIVMELTKAVLHDLIKENIDPSSTLMTDEFLGYKGIDLVHEVINHADGYVRDHIHSNGIENFWSCLKRGLNGTYIAVEPFHLFRYIDEQIFRFNLRDKHSDASRFRAVLKDILGRRLTYAELTGKGLSTAF